MKRTSEKSFGILFFVVMFLIGIWPLLNNNSVRVWALVLSFIFLGIALLKQELLKPLNSLWIKFGENLGKIIIQKLIKGENVNPEDSSLSKREWNELMVAFDLTDKII